MTDSPKVERKKITELTDSHWIDIDAVQLWSRNYQSGDVGAIMLSIQKFGFDNALRIWNGTVMAGNHSTIAVRQLLAGGWQPFGGAIRSNGDKTEVLYVDISHLTYEQAQAFAVADNRTAQLAEPDDLLLVELLQEFANSEDETLLQASGYDGDDLDNLLRDLNPQFEPVSADEQPRLDELQPIVCPHCGKNIRDRIHE